MLSKSLRHAVAFFVLVFGFFTLPAFANAPFSALTIDARTGQILYADQIDGLRHPASLTKMMTLYVLFQDMKSGRITRETKLHVSARAAGMAPSKLHLHPGESITVDDAIRALVTKSANDVAATIAENLGGSEGAYAARMTRVAHSIGMTHSSFYNASGLPNPGQYTTARDMATLGLRLMRDFPQYYPYFRITSFHFRGRLVRTHNTLVQYYPGTDGIKTGYIAASGYNLVTSTKHGDKRLVGVVLGARSSATRARYMRSMLERNFANAKDGNTIAALAGSSKGAVNPVQQHGEAAIASNDQVETSSLSKVAQDAAQPQKPEVTVTSANDKPAVLPNALAASWNIDLGSFSKKTQAEVKIATIRGMLGSSLTGKSAFTMQDDASGKPSFKARMAGFDAATAKKICAKVIKLGAACQTIAPLS